MALVKIWITIKSRLSLGLDKAIEFAGYQISLDEAYDQAQLFVDASRIDAQPLAMGEALNHGVPVVSYDYLYGPREMVISGKNGEIIPLNNQGQFIQTVVKLLQDQDELQSLSTGAYDNLDKLAEEKIWKQWQQLSAI
nr:glycosyltransferase [Limosilactobacillus reuteri]